MANRSQTSAVINYRKRLKDRGLARFEVLALQNDHELIRSLARQLAENGPEAGRIRGAVQSAILDDSSQKGGILRALRRSPLVGADIHMRRPLTHGRKVDS